MKIYVLTEEYSFGSKYSVSFEVLDAYKSEEQAIKAMKHQHENNMKLIPWRLRDKDDIYIEETENSIYILDDTDAEHYYLLKVEPITLQD